MIALKNRIGSVAVLGAVAVALLGGCGQAPSTAAKVGETTVTMQQLDTATEACLPSFPQDPEGDVRSVVANGLYGSAVAKVLSSSGTVVSDSEVDASLDSLGTATLLPECRSALKGVVESRLLVQKLGAEKTSELLKNVDVTVNPAVGDVNASKTELVARSGSMSSVGRVFGSTTAQ